MNHNSKQNLDNIFRYKSNVTYLTVFLSFVFAITVFYVKNKEVEEKSQQVFILKESDGSIFLAETANIRENRGVELKSHIRNLHNLLFFLTPNQNLIEEQIKRAYYLGDNSIVEFHRRRIENDFYHDLVATGSSTEFQIDSIGIDIATYPYQVLCVGMERIIRSDLIIYNKVESYLTVTNTIRTNENPHGFDANFKLKKYNEILRKKR